MDATQPLMIALERVAAALQDGPLHPTPHDVTLPPVGDRKFLVVNDESTVVDLTKLLEDAMPFTLAPAGSFAFADMASFLAYVKRYSTEPASIYWKQSDLSVRPSAVAEVECVFDEWKPPVAGEPKDFYPRRVWRANIELRISPELEAWANNDRKAMPSAKFAEFIEENIEDLPAPTGEKMLKVATTIQGKRTLSFKSGVRLDNGMVDIAYVEGGSDSAGSGANGNLKIPQMFEIAIPVFKNLDAGIKLAARFKYRLQGDGSVLMQYELVKPWKAVELAVSEQMKAVLALGLPVYQKV